MDASGTPTLVGTITAASNDSGGTVHAGAHFGRVLSAFSGGVTIGAPDDTVSGLAGAGSIVMTTWDTGTGKVTGASYQTQDSAGVPGAAEAGDHFGAALFSEGSVTLVGVPGEDVGTLKDAGSVQMYHGGKPGPSITQNSAGVPGTAEAGDQFGASVTFGTWFLSQEGEDIAIGSPGEDIGSAKDAGSVTLLTIGDKPGSYSASKTLTQGTGGLGGGIESGDRVGATLGVLRGDPASDEDTADYLIVGAPGEDISGSTDCGLITYYRHSGTPGNFEDGRVAYSQFGTSFASVLTTPAGG